MDKNTIISNIRKKQSFLCIGLDTDLAKIPSYIIRTSDDPVFQFNKHIVDATHDLVVAYKPNIDFYESMGAKGWYILEKTIEYIKSEYPDIFLIADAKRGDIGNTSKQYAKAFFETISFDAITVNPYMGEDSVRPYLEYDNKWVIVLALTSNKGASNFQLLQDKKGKRLFESVLDETQKWGNSSNMMYVVGATKAIMLEEIRKLIPEHFLLIPGIGAQGGSLQEVAQYGTNREGGIIINSSRSIIYADSTHKFTIKAREKTRELQFEMQDILSKIHFENTK